MSWLLDSLIVLPLALAVVVGLGLPLALLLLPRVDWQHRALIAALSIALGTAAQTAWMFVLGTLGQLHAVPLLAGLIVIGVLAWALAVRKYRAALDVPRTAKPPLTALERVLLLGIAASVLGAWLTTSFWPFMAYDTLWVYGFQARVYTLTHEIPITQGYYPQYLQLQYAFYQIIMGAVNDHYARVVVLLMHVGSICAAYVLGSGVYALLGSRVMASRRAGFMSAALWAFYPHVLQWVQMGDLEVPLTFTLTLSGALLLRAWFCHEVSLARRYALLAGIVFGISLWTKPTAGAFVWGVMLLTAIEFVRVRGCLRRFWPRFQLAAIMGLACVPLGGVWYARNFLLGHPVVDLPHPSWLLLARRSGDLLGWLLLLAVLLAVWMLWQRRARWRGSLVGAGLLLAGALPSMPWVNPARVNPPASHLTLLEAALVAAGVVAIAWALWPYAARPVVQRSTAALLLALPYFVTWFHSYSYHARLSFAIVPLLALPSAWLLAHWPPWRLPRAAKRLALGALGIVLCASFFVPLRSVAPEEGLAQYWDNRFPDADAKYFKTNPSLMILVHALRDFETRTGQPFRLMAPGEQQLRFFFPTHTMDNYSVPTTLDNVAGFTHFLYGNHAEWWYRDFGLEGPDTQLVAALGRTDLIQRTAFHDDATFRYELYELNLAPRHAPVALNVMVAQRVEIGGFARLMGWENTATSFRGQTVFVNLLWEALAPTSVDAYILLELTDIASGEVVYTWREAVMPHVHGSYRTSLWTAGEFVRTQHRLQIDPDQASAMLPGQQYHLSVRMETVDGQALPMSIDGDTASRFAFLPVAFQYR